MKVRKLVLALIVTLIAVGTVQAKMYRWVDENGTTVYSQSPPPEGNATEIKATHAPSPRSADNGKKPVEQPADTASEEAPDDEETARKKAESDAIKAEACTTHMKNLQVYRNVGNKLLQTPDGLYIRLTDEEREKRIKETQEQIKEFCEE